MNNNTHQQGFTLIETTIALFSSSVLLIVLYALQQTIQVNQFQLFNQYLSTNTTNTNMLFITKTIRTIQPSQNGSYPIYSASPDELVVFSDIDYDNIVERVRFKRVGDTLTKGITEPVGIPATYPDDQEKTSVLIDNLSNGLVPIFTYYNESWPADQVRNPLSMPNDKLHIRLIHITIKTNNSNRPIDEYALDTFVQLRTLKNNF